MLLYSHREEGPWRKEGSPMNKHSDDRVLTDYGFGFTVWEKLLESVNNNNTKPNLNNKN